ncbi:MAG TPA: TIGR03088 family PEP-CTERM/XrtA system glycosyltransferase [Casimicrobiaceae bacterium]
MNISEPSLIVHVVYRFAVGGLENGLVNLINRLPPKRWRHAVVSLTSVDAQFAERIARDDVQFVALGKDDGHAIHLYPRLFRLFRSLAPRIVHTRNLAALEAAVPAWLARVPARIHGEHGRDIDDLDGTSVRRRRVRKAFAPFVTRYVAVSPDLAQYLEGEVKIAQSRIQQIWNGVDTDAFKPRAAARTSIAGCPFDAAQHWLVGSVGRFDPVKDHATLARAFVSLVANRPALRSRARLVFVGDGATRRGVESILAKAGVGDCAWFAGERHDVAHVMQGLDCFVLPSLAEGVSNTILEAMASGLPVVATRVGANPQLVVDGHTGRLVPAADHEAMALRIEGYMNDETSVREHGRNGRAVIERRFSLDAMVDAYDDLYARLCAGATLADTRASLSPSRLDA